MTLQFTNDLAEFNQVTVTVTTRTGSNAHGNVYSAPVDVVGFVEQKKHISRQQSGDTAGSSRSNTSTIFYGPVAAADLFSNDSRVTYLGQPYEVYLVDVYTSGTLGLPDHVAVSLL